VLDTLLRMLAEVGPRAIWLVIFFAAVVAVFVAYVGVALWATLRASDPEQQKLRYQVFRDLLGLFRRKGRR
jgi:hypothetical protein